MPQRPPDTILQYTLVVATALRNVSVETQIPFLAGVSNLSLSIVPMIQNTRAQKERCLRMVEEIHRFLCALTGLCLHLEGIRAPKMLDQIAQYAQTLQKFHACLRAQQDLGKIRRLFKQSEITAQLDACEKELKAASNVVIVSFKTQYGVGVASAIAELDIDTERRHQELLELISAGSGPLDSASSIRSSLNSSSASFSLLPASPKIFHGRNSELSELVSILLSDPARAAILGPGGMGKTTLATAALHEPAIIEKYHHRHFMSCESAYTSIDLVTMVGLHLGLKPSRKLSDAIVQHFREFGPSLIVLDNFETPWESLESRTAVENFISVLADIPSLALLITMRGAERPGKVKWNRPFLAPLNPLSVLASRQIFSDVADEPEVDDEPAVSELLNLSGRLPLAVSLMANIAAFEGYSGTLSRWKVENTALLSDGHEKRTNLEKSIILSLGSPRIWSSPHAKDLLSLLSLLPDGITQEELVVSNVPIPHIGQGKSVLLRTSLAYMDVNNRLKALSPIREYIRRAHPPSLVLFKPLCTHFQDLLSIWLSHRELSSGDLVPRIAANLGNINNLMLQGLTEDKATNISIAHSIITLNEFSQITLKGPSPLMQKLPDLVEATGDSDLRWKYTTAYLKSQRFSRVGGDAEDLITAGVEYFKRGDRFIDQALGFYEAAGTYYLMSMNIPSAVKFRGLAAPLAEQTDNMELKLQSLSGKRSIAFALGNHREIIKLAREAQKIGTLAGLPGDCHWVISEASANGYIGNLKRGLELCEQVHERLAILGMEGSDQGLHLLDVEAQIHWLKSEYTEARRAHETIVSMTSPHDSANFHANSLLTLAQLGIACGRPETDIVGHLNAAVAVYSTYGIGGATLTELNAELQLYKGEKMQARALFEQCLLQSRGSEQEIANLCVSRLADPKHKMYDHGDIFNWAMVYLALAGILKDRVYMFHALRCLGDVYTLSDDDETALALFQSALQGATEMDIHRLRGESMVGIGDIMLRRGEPGEAQAMWKAAHPLFVRSSQIAEAAEVDVRLNTLART
ncbi:hypothetical protein DFH07DRAFT_990938 [Mycena maculata]|uniref:Novel STAND NTPase 1 domain-containing protein n=1 Tax=Mycena maculata TaxID=230809 RepID=A0AAD7I1S8_9AGAR|nr:hypothetical protein DFH07DRAFT_990938 [Mycena maculata]